MFYLGIDIGKYNHVASLLDEHSKVIFKGFSFPNTTAGADSLLAKIASYPLDDLYRHGSHRALLAGPFLLSH